MTVAITSEGTHGLPRPDGKRSPNSSLWNRSVLCVARKAWTEPGHSALGMLSPNARSSMQRSSRWHEIQHLDSTEPGADQSFAQF
jgi:hypothetical protein